MDSFFNIIINAPNNVSLSVKCSYAYLSSRSRSYLEMTKVNI